MRFLAILLMGLASTAHAQYRTNRFFCSGQYNSINVEVHPNQYVVTLNVPLGHNPEAYLGDFYAHIPGRVWWDGKYNVLQINAVSSKYMEGHYDPRRHRESRWKKPRWIPYPACCDS